MTQEFVCALTGGTGWNVQTDVWTSSSTTTFLALLADYFGGLQVSVIKIMYILLVITNDEYLFYSTYSQIVGQTNTRNAQSFGR